jgi:hypothetical protein
MTDVDARCCFCGKPNEPWPGAAGYGNNPEPLLDYENGRCCNNCNSFLVINARLAQMTDDRTRYNMMVNTANQMRKDNGL